MDEARSLTYSINVRADTSGTEQNIRDLTGSLGSLSSQADNVSAAFRKSFLAGIDSGDSFASSIRSGVVGAIAQAGDQAGSLGSAFSNSFRSGIADGDSLASSLRAGVGGALTYVGEQAGEFRDNIIEGAQKIGHGFAHPIETIKNGLGNAVQAAKDKFIEMARGADSAADSTGDLGDAADDAEDDMSNLGNAADEAGDAADKSGGKFEKFGSILKGIGVALVAATTAVGVFAASSLGVGMEFDSSMSQVAATMGYSVEELNTVGSEANKTFTELRGFAMEMGANTAFSASQAADALNYMALAGYDAQTSMTMLPNVLNLAAAGGIELAAASDMVTDAQSALGLTLDETSELVDKMAMASSKSNTSVEQLGNAVLAIGGTAKNLAGGTTELSTALGILADNGIKGAEGGTHLRNIIMSLGSPSDTAAKALEKLGISVFDADGNMRPLNETFGDLNDALSTMSQGDRLAAIGDIFNTTDIASVNALLSTSSERWEELTGYINDADGAAQNMAETQLDNLAGDITLFKSALEGAQIVISDQLTPNLREFVQFGSDAVSTLSAAFQEGGLSGAMGALGGILSDAVGMITGMLPTLLDAGMQLLGALGQGLLDNMPLIIDAAIQIVTLLGEGILSSLPVLVNAGTQVIVSLASGIGGMLPTLIPSVTETVLLIVSTLIENLPLLLDAGMQLISCLAEGIIGAIPILIGQLPVLINQILGFLSESLPAILEQGAAILISLADGLIGAIPMLVEMLPDIITSICGFVAESLPTILEQGVVILTSLADGLIGAIPLLVDQLPQIISSIVGFVTENLPTIVTQGIQILTNLATGIISALPELIGQLPAIISGIVGTLSENFPSIVSAGVTLLQELGNGIISAIPELLTQLPAIGAAILGALGEIPGMVIGVGKNIVEGLWNGVSSMVDWAIEKIKGFGSSIVSGLKEFLGIHSPSTVFAEIGDNMALGLGGGFGEGMKGVTEDIKGAIPTDLDGPEINIPDPDVPDPNTPNAPPDLTYGVYPNVENYDLPGNGGPVFYSINAATGDDDYDPSNGDGMPKPAPGGGNGDYPEPGRDNSPAIVFAPEVKIEITVQGNADEDALEELKASLREEFEAKMRELFAEFREEELQQAALKNQFAF